MCAFVSRADRESREHEEPLLVDGADDLPPAKVPILPKDILNSRKAQAVRKEQKRKQGKQRNMGSPLDYSPLPIDKHEPEFVRVPHSRSFLFHPTD